jgi:hypothetical protein
VNSSFPVLTNELFIVGDVNAYTFSAKLQDAHHPDTVGEVTARLNRKTISSVGSDPGLTVIYGGGEGDAEQRFTPQETRPLLGIHQDIINKSTRLQLCHPK